MKLVTKLTVAATLATFMFAGVNLTWGNAFSNNEAGATGDELQAAHSFGIWIDVNDTASFGWENGLKVGFSGPAGLQMRLGMDPGSGGAAATTSIGVSRAWWTSTGDGWGTNLSTAIDWGMTGDGAEDFTITMNLGFGF
jgi:hypothetical protein